MRNWFIFTLCMLGQMAFAQVQFEDRSEGLPEHIYSGGWEHFVGGGVAVFDCDGDALPDLYAAGGTQPARLMHNNGNFEFEVVASPRLTGVSGAYPLDIDADGFMDLFVLRVGANVVLRGKGDCRFENATQAMGFVAEDRWSTAFTAWWKEGGDRPQMAVGNYVDRLDPNGPFEACDDNTLLTPAAQGYVSSPLSPGYCTLSLLAARDAWGLHRLRFSNDRHYYVSGGKEQMWDIAEKRFLTTEDGWPDLSVWGMGIASRDITGDGRDEIVLTSMGDQLLQLAKSDGYRAAPFDIGTYAHRPHMGGDGRPSTGWHAEFGDVNNDGLPDLFIAKGNVDQMPGMAMRDPNNLLMQQAGGTFVEAAAQAGVASLARSRGAALADFDNDGKLDLLVMNRRAPMELYRNKTPDAGNWVRIKLKQLGGNRDAVGARVDLFVGENIQSMQKLVGGGHAGGQALPLHFGLGQGVAAQVVVRWPDGSIGAYRVQAGETATLEKGS
ncbi:CRTAC1 family protein [Sulfitobacter sp. F26204]|uniref:CRTAC1 family protein n=1 Tax=Sulfitobacter sp. F26204 TaxID=2996014 RepID=UPI00225E61EB|nr:CRTAC1 family protein [Sulfitobacter sp. F26204]MCX7560605.1 CRTAC1 family protein [Sulfitobacter sp. F26204]